MGTRALAALLLAAPTAGAAGCTSPTDQQPGTLAVLPAGEVRVGVEAFRSLAAVRVPEGGGAPVPAAGVVWESSDEAVVVAWGDGGVEGVAPGRAHVTARDPATGAAASVPVLCRPAEFEWLRIDPPEVCVRPGLMAPVRARGRDVRGATGFVSSRVSWSTADTEVAHYDSSEGGVMGGSPGVTTLRADSLGVYGEATVRVDSSCRAPDLDAGLSADAGAPADAWVDLQVGQAVLPGRPFSTGEELEPIKLGTCGQGLFHIFFALRAEGEDIPITGEGVAEVAVLHPDPRVVRKQAIPRFNLELPDGNVMAEAVRIILGPNYEAWLGRTVEMRVILDAPPAFRPSAKVRFQIVDGLNPDRTWGCCLPDC